MSCLIVTCIVIIVVTTGKTRSILQPTPLVVALGKQLMSQLVSDTNEISDEETRRETDGSTNPQGRVEGERERIPLADKEKVSQLLSWMQNTSS